MKSFLSDTFRLDLSISSIVSVGFPLSGASDPKLFTERTIAEFNNFPERNLGRSGDNTRKTILSARPIPRKILGARMNGWIGGN
jgi:hypothetical protein